MKVKELIEQLQTNLDPDVEIDFLAIDTHSCEGGSFWLSDPIVSKKTRTIIFTTGIDESK